MLQILKSKYFHFALGISVSVILIGWMIKVVDWGTVWTVLKQGNYLILLPSFLIVIIHFCLRAVRWRVLLPANADISLRDLFDSIMLGNFANFILPLRAGEFIRPGMASLKGNASFSTCFVSVVIERFFDLSTVLIMFSVLLVYVPSVPDWVNNGAASLGLLAIALFVFIMLSAFFPEMLSRIVRWFAGFLPKQIKHHVEKFLVEFITGAVVLRHEGRAIKAAILSLLVWGSAIVTYFVFFYLFDIQGSWLMAATLTVILALAVAAPSAPGFIGVYQTACIAGFALFGLDKEMATAYAIATHAYQFVIFIVYGIYLLFKHDLSLGKLQKESHA